MRRLGTFGRRCTPSCRRTHGVGGTRVGTTRGRSRRFWRTCGRSSSNASARSSTVRPLACRGCQLGGLTVVVVVLQAGTRMRACLSPAARTGQPLWRRLRAGHRSTTGPRVRGITKPPPVLSSDLSLLREINWCQGMSMIKSQATQRITRSMPRRTSPSSPCATCLQSCNRLRVALPGCLAFMSSLLYEYDMSRGCWQVKGAGHMVSAAHFTVSAKPKIRDDSAIVPRCRRCSRSVPSPCSTARSTPQAPGTGRAPRTPRSPSI